MGYYYHHGQAAVVAKQWSATQRSEDLISQGYEKQQAIEQAARETGISEQIIKDRRASSTAYDRQPQNYVGNAYSSRIDRAVKEANIDRLEKAGDISEQEAERRKELLGGYGLIYKAELDGKKITGTKDYVESKVKEYEKGLKLKENIQKSLFEKQGHKAVKTSEGLRVYPQLYTRRKQFIKSILERQGSKVKVKGGVVKAKKDDQKTIISPLGDVIKVPKKAKVDIKGVNLMAKERIQPKKETIVTKYQPTKEDKILEAITGRIEGTKKRMAQFKEFEEKSEGMQRIKGMAPIVSRNIIISGLFGTIPLGGQAIKKIYPLKKTDKKGIMGQIVDTVTYGAMSWPIYAGALIPEATEKYLGRRETYVRIPATRKGIEEEELEAAKKVGSMYVFQPKPKRPSPVITTGEPKYSRGEPITLTIKQKPVELYEQQKAKYKQDLATWKTRTVETGAIYASGLVFGLEGVGAVRTRTGVIDLQRGKGWRYADDSIPVSPGEAFIKMMSSKKAGVKSFRNSKEKGIKIRSKALKNRGVKEQVVAISSKGVRVTEKGQAPNRYGLTTYFRDKQITQQFQEKGTQAGYRKQYPKGFYSQRTKVSKPMTQLIDKTGGLVAVQYKYPAMLKYDKPKKLVSLIQNKGLVYDPQMIIKRKPSGMPKEILWKYTKRTEKVPDKVRQIKEKPRGGFRPGMRKRIFARIQKTQAIKRLQEEKTWFTRPPEDVIKDIDVIPETRAITELESPFKDVGTTLSGKKKKYILFEDETQQPILLGDGLKDQSGITTGYKNILIGRIKDAGAISLIPTVRGLPDIKQNIGLAQAQTPKLMQSVDTTAAQKAELAQTAQLAQIQALDQPNIITTEQISDYVTKTDKTTRTTKPGRTFEQITRPKNPKRPPKLKITERIKERPPRKPPRKPPREPPTKKKYLSKIKKALKKKETGYYALIKRKQIKKGKGKYTTRGYKRLNKEPLTKKGAEVLLMEMIDKFTNRSGKIIKAKTAAKSKYKDQLRDMLIHKFRKAKKNSNIIVEKARFAIDSYQEKLGIPYEAQRLRTLGLFNKRNGGKKTTWL